MLEIMTRRVTIGINMLAIVFVLAGSIYGYLAFVDHAATKNRHLRAELITGASEEQNIEALRSNFITLVQNQETESLRDTENAIFAIYLSAIAVGLLVASTVLTFRARDEEHT